MTQQTRLALLAGAVALAAGPAAAHHDSADGMTPEQHAADHAAMAADRETGVTGVPINEAAPSDVTREGGLSWPDDAGRPDDSPRETFRPAPASPDAAARSPRASAATTLTAAQLDDADIVNRAGMELAEVEAVLVGPDGEPVAVLAELEDDVFGEERLIQIDLADLEPRPARQYRNIWEDRIDLVTDHSLGWFETAQDWNMQPRTSTESASR